MSKLTAKKIAGTKDYEVHNAEGKLVGYLQRLTATRWMVRDPRKGQRGITASRKHGMDLIALRLAKGYSNKRG